MNNKSFSIGPAQIGAGKPCFVVAEIGLNHNGDITLAKKLIDVALNAGASAVKFQKRTVSELATKEVLDAQDKRFPGFGDTYRKVREHVELSADEYRELVTYTKSKGLIFLCTPFDPIAVDFLEELNVCAYKIASHGLTNLALLRAVAKTNKPVILSTGMCTLEEIDLALDILAQDVALLHCVSSYPQSADESNLRMISKLQKRYNLPVGYSGHEIGYLPTLIAVGLGACVVERHITLDCKMIGFDHKLSLEPDDLERMIQDIRSVESMLGSGQKLVTEREQVTRDKYRVSIVSKCRIMQGERLTPEVLTLKNPGTGIPASEIDKVVGRTAKKEIPEDTLLSYELFS